MGTNIPRHSISPHRKSRQSRYLLLSLKHLPFHKILKNDNSMSKEDLGQECRGIGEAEAHLIYSALGRPITVKTLSYGYIFPATSRRATACSPKSSIKYITLLPVINNKADERRAGAYSNVERVAEWNTKHG
ncbi:hypothetical protein SK128_017203 [Halocaridina rubra]|uniref:Uncharacterized protein n=1 Tax=Halocaridina rubra TaxID=373956 RepID=A0AAN8WRL7_HALRR